MEKYNTKAVEDKWSTFDCAASDKNFYAYPPIRSRSSELIFGESDASRADWAEYWTVKKILKNKIPFEHCLSICCGFGEVERTLAKLGAAKKISGTDIAPGAIKVAQERAKEENLSNIDYFVADLNELEIPEGKYDLIWANGALHHIKDLDNVMPKLYKALKKGGYLIANEYVGHTYQQLSSRHQEIINAVKHLLPPELTEKTVHAVNKSFLSRSLRYLDKKLNKFQRVDTSIYKKIWEMPSLNFFLETDPSESVGSENIIPAINKCFSNVDIRGFGGSILYYALDSKFYDNFNPQNKKHKLLLEMLFNLEEKLIASGELVNDNAHIICVK